MSSRLGFLLWGPAALGALLLAAAPSNADAQFDKLKKKAKQKVEQKTDEKTDAAVDSTINRADPTASSGAAQPAGDKSTDSVQAPAPAATPAAAAALKPGEGAWANYDFKPGERILFFEDFSNDEVGDFPRRMEFQSGALEIVEWQGTRYIRATEDSRFFLVLPEALPERFTMEFDYTIPGSGEVWISFGDENKKVVFGGSGTTGVNNGPANVNATATSRDGDLDKLRRARVLGDGPYLKVYLDDTRTLNVPNAAVGRSNKILFFTDAVVDKPTLFGNFRVAAGGKKLYDALTEKGRVSTQGIYFDSGSDRLRPESTPTLKEIGTMLKEHSDLKLLIEGHTDNVGKAEANLSLSERRANAVRQYLIDTFQIDGGRLEGKGLGQTKPVSPNETPEGRQNNRRVELVKM